MASRTAVRDYLQKQLDQLIASLRGLDDLPADDTRKQAQELLAQSILKHVQAIAIMDDEYCLWAKNSYGPGTIYNRV